MLLSFSPLRSPLRESEQERVLGRRLAYRIGFFSRDDNIPAFSLGESKNKRESRDMRFSPSCVSRTPRLSLKTLIQGSSSDFVERAPPHFLARYFRSFALLKFLFLFPFSKFSTRAECHNYNSLLVHFEFISVFALQLYVLV